MYRQVEELLKLFELLLEDRAALQVPLQLLQVEMMENFLLPLGEFEEMMEIKISSAAFEERKEGLVWRCDKTPQGSYRFIFESSI